MRILTNLFVWGGVVVAGCLAAHYGVVKAFMLTGIPIPWFWATSLWVGVIVGAGLGVMAILRPSQRTRLF